jgi:DNA-binding CsgD family transcriptional regulator
MPGIVGGMNAVSLRDARTLIDVAGTIEYDSARGAFITDGLTPLLGLLGADWVTYCEGPIGSADHRVKCEVETRPFAGHSEELEAIFIALFHQYPLGRRPPPESGVILIGDVMTDRAWRRTRIYNEWCREVHIEPQAKISLSVPGSPLRRALVFDVADDAGRCFGERERSLLGLVRRALMRPIALAEAAKECLRALGLTARELEVLGLLRQGRTNCEIATELFVSPATIRTHLENTFAKLGAHTRTEAIARLDEIGVFPRTKHAKPPESRQCEMPAAAAMEPRSRQGCSSG